MDKYVIISLTGGDFMKKTLLTLILVLSLILVGCDSKTNEVPKKPSNDEAASTIDDTKEDDELPIHPDDVKPVITILEPNSIGEVYMEATYTNNSKHPITGYTATVLLKDTNETTYLGTHDTVMPGETSSKFDTFGPKTQNDDDYEILKLKIVAKNEDGNDLYIDYDFKLNEASWLESEDD